MAREVNERGRGHMRNYFRRGCVSGEEGCGVGFNAGYGASLSQHLGKKLVFSSDR